MGPLRQDWIQFGGPREGILYLRKNESTFENEIRTQSSNHPERHIYVAIQLQIRLSRNSCLSDNIRGAPDITCPTRLTALGLRQQPNTYQKG